MANLVAEKSVNISSLVADHIERLELEPRVQRVAYHQPCHLKALPHAGATMALLSGLPGLELDCLATHCCGMAGSWGMLDNHALSMEMGQDLKTKFVNSPARAGATDCPTCRMQMEALSSKPMFHPIEILAGYVQTPPMEG